MPDVTVADPSLEMLMLGTAATFSSKVIVPLKGRPVNCKLGKLSEIFEEAVVSVPLVAACAGNTMDSMIGESHLAGRRLEAVIVETPPMMVFTTLRL
jgi:hypothetical protein